MKVKMRDIPFILLVLWLIVWNFGITEFQVFYPVNLLAWIVRILLIIYAILTFKNSIGVKKHQLYIFFFIVSFFLFLCVKEKNTRYYDTLFIALLLRNADYKKILQIGSRSQLIIIITTILSSLIGIIPNEQVFNAGRIRYNLGFIYCSYSANMLFFATACWIASLKRNRKIKLKEVIFLITLNYLVFWYTDTKASFWGTLFLVILSYCMPSKPFKRYFTKIKTVIISGIVPIFALASIIISLFYDASNPLHVFFNTISSGRIYMGYYGLKTYGIKLFGSNIKWATDHTTTYFYVDSSYINILLTMGLIALVLICIGFVRLGYYSVQLNDRNMSLVLLFVAIHCFTDPQLIDLRYNLFIIICINSFNNLDIISSKSVENCVGSLPKSKLLLG